jgi:hypothetical protein
MIYNDTGDHVVEDKKDIVLWILLTTKCWYKLWFEAKMSRSPKHSTTVGDGEWSDCYLVSYYSTRKRKSAARNTFCHSIDICCLSLCLLYKTQEAELRYRLAENLILKYHRIEVRPSATVPLPKPTTYYPTSTASKQYAVKWVCIWSDTTADCRAALCAASCFQFDFWLSGEGSRVENWLIFRKHRYQGKMIWVQKRYSQFYTIYSNPPIVSEGQVPWIRCKFWFCEYGTCPFSAGI